MIPGKLPPTDAILNAFVRFTNNPSDENQKLTAELSIADGRRASALDTVRNESDRGPSLRALLSTAIGKHLSNEGTPDEAKVKWHVECCIRKMMSFAMSTLKP